MAYCTKDEVISEFKDLEVEDSGTSIITSELEAWVAEGAALIDSYLCTVYVTPVVGGASALLVLKTCNIQIVAQRVKDTLRVKTGEEKVNQEFGTNLRKIAEETLKRLVKKDSLLVGAELLNSSGGVKSYTADHDIKPIFRKERPQW